MQYIKLAKLADFQREWIKSYEVLGRHLAIVKQRDGSYFATEVSCKHQNADLTCGEFDGMLVTCHRHGWKYDLRTGECLNQPSTPLRRHGLKIQGDEIFVSLHPLPVQPPDSSEDPMPEITFRTRGDSP